MRNHTVGLNEAGTFERIKRHKSVHRSHKSKEHRYERRKVKEWIHRIEDLGADRELE